MKKIIPGLLALTLSFFCLFSCTPSSESHGEQYLLPFKGIDINNRQVDLTKSVGNRPIVLVFWASWCPGCASEVAAVNRLAERYQSQGLEVVSINIAVNDSVERARAFAKKHKMNYPSLFDVSGILSERYMIQGVPTIIVADKRGVIRSRTHAAPKITDAKFAQLLAD